MYEYLNQLTRLSDQKDFTEFGENHIYISSLISTKPIHLRRFRSQFWLHDGVLHALPFTNSLLQSRNIIILYNLQLNMFLAFSRPSSGAQWLQRQPPVLPSYHGDSCAVFVVGPVGPTTNTAQLSPRYEGKTGGCRCSHWAPDDGWENARNMLSCKQTSG